MRKIRNSTYFFRLILRTQAKFRIRNGKLWIDIQQNLQQKFMQQMALKSWRVPIPMYRVFTASSIGKMLSFFFSSLRKKPDFLSWVGLCCRYKSVWVHKGPSTMGEVLSVPDFLARIHGSFSRLLEKSIGTNCISVPRLVFFSFELFFKI